MVDDEESVCSMFCAKLEEEGFECESCLSAESALRRLSESPFDAVISDLKMPGIGGLGLLREAVRSHPSLAVIMATGESDVRVGIEAMRQGAADYLVKPVQLDAAVLSLKRALEEKRLQREVERYRRTLEEMVEQRTRQLQTAMRRVEQTYDDTLEVLGAALDLRDTETAGHSRRVSLYCLEMSRGLGNSPEQLKVIARGSYLHDIGKIGIPDAILLKEGKLTPDETAIMQTHVRIGYELVSSIPFLAAAAEIVLTHQERFDGTGYPQGLMAEEIPLGARVFAIADTLDAMTSDRPYRKALPFSAAREEIQRESGRQFDPDVVKVFLSISESVWQKIRREIAASRRYLPLVASREIPPAAGLRPPGSDIRKQSEV